MSNVYINQSGFGQCYVDNYSPSYIGEPITIYAHADLYNHIVDLTVTDQGGQSIAVSLVPDQTIYYDPMWGDITINCTFSQNYYIDLILTGDGNGHTHVSNDRPVAGEVVDLFAYATDRKSELVSIVGMDSYGNDIGLITSAYQQFTFDPNWGNITIVVTIDLKWLYHNLWIIANNDKWWRKRLY